MLVVYPFRLILELAEGRHTLPPYLGKESDFLRRKKVPDLVIIP